nr:caspase-4 [Cavia porcellus]
MTTVEELSPPKLLKPSIHAPQGIRETAHRKGCGDLDYTVTVKEDLDYSVIVKENLTARCMESVLSEFAGKPEHKSSDSIFFVLMSHRILHGISGTLHSDDSPDVLQYDTIFKIFNNCSCPGLRDKPKVIIVQTCRSEKHGEVWVKYSEAAPKDSLAQSSENLESDAIHKIHVEKDFIIFYTTTPHRWDNSNYLASPAPYLVNENKAPCK